MINILPSEVFGFVRVLEYTWSLIAIRDITRTRCANCSGILSFHRLKTEYVDRWTHLWFSPNDIAQWSTKGIRIRIIVLCLKYWENGGMPWAQRRSRSTMTLRQKWKKLTSRRIQIGNGVAKIGGNLRRQVSKVVNLGGNWTALGKIQTWDHQQMMYHWLQELPMKSLYPLLQYIMKLLPLRYIYVYIFILHRNLYISPPATKVRPMVRSNPVKYLQNAERYFVLSRLLISRTRIG